MTRNLKALGLALVAAFAMSAVVASAASAESAFKFKSNTANPILTATQHGSNVDVFTTDAGTVSCNTANYVGSQAGTETNEIEVAPTYSGCTAFGFIGVPIHTNGCKYRFTTGTKTGSDFEGSVHIVCPTTTSPSHKQHVIEITAPFSCTVTVPGGQTPAGKVTFTNLGSGHTQEVTVDVDLTGITYEEHDSDSFPCPSDTVLKHNGTYEGAALTTGENAEEEHIGVFVG